MAASTRTTARTLAAAALAVLTAAAAPAPLTVRASMVDVVAPRSQAVWDLTGEAYDDKGEPDARRLKPADWTTLAEAGRTLSDTAAYLATAEQLPIVRGGEKIENEGDAAAPTAHQVEALIQADRTGFAARARAMEDAARAITAAAQARDITRLVAASDAMTDTCQACHAAFWYPQNGG